MEFKKISNNSKEEASSIDTIQLNNTDEILLTAHLVSITETKPLVVWNTDTKIYKVWDGNVFSIFSNFTAQIQASLQNGTSSFEANNTVTITINGDYFNADTSGVSLTNVAIGNLTINSVTYISAHEIEVQFETGALVQFYDVVVSNDRYGSITLSNVIEIFPEVVWEDLRSTGVSLTLGTLPTNDVQVRTGMTVLRDSSGIYFTGAAPWSSWARFRFMPWIRGQNKTMQMILTGIDGNMMAGIGSTNANGSSGTQYVEQEVQCYFTNSTNFWGMYGSSGSQSNGVSFASGSTLKFVFENDGSNGSLFTMYLLPSANQGDWDDVSNPIKSFNIILNPNNVNLFPVIVPRNGGSTRVVALKLN